MPPGSRYIGAFDGFFDDYSIGATGTGSNAATFATWAYYTNNISPGTTNAGQLLSGRPPMFSA